LSENVFSVDQDGRVIRINYNNTQRDSFFTEPVEDVLLWYDAFAKFVELMHGEVSSSKLIDGNILTFDNMRILHGRSNYSDSSDNSRCVVGVYVDWDQMYSRWRVLKESTKKGKLPILG
jgi:gamma-butyrobetaine dioxygenase